MARARAKKKLINPESKANLAREKRKSKKLGYSLTEARRRRERAASKQAIDTAKKLKDVVPSLKKLAKKKRLTAAEKGKITRYAKESRGALSSLVPVSASYAKRHPDLIFKKGFQAIQFRNISSDAKVVPVGENVFIESNGRTFIYWKLHSLNKRNVKKKLGDVAERAFTKDFDPELLAALADKAFKEFDVQSVYLWVHSGRADTPFDSLNQFTEYLSKWYSSGGSGQANSDPSDWVNGIAILIQNKPPAKKKAQRNATAKRKKT